MPSRRTIQTSLIVLGAWTLFGLLIAQQTQLQLRLRNETRPFFTVVMPPMFAAWLWAFNTPFVVAATRRLRAMRESRSVWVGWPLYLAAHALLGVSLMLLGTRVWVAVRPLIDGIHTPWPSVIAYSILLDTASYVAIVTVAEAMAYAAAYRERDREAATLARTAADLQERLDEARLHALEAQLRPHFLYNTLNLIAELVHDEPDVADEMLTRLGMLLRRAYRASEHLVPLGEELAFVQAYAEILARRYRDRVTVCVDVADALRDVRVPVFSLQPLVENAFRHGVERRESRTSVDIVGVAREGMLVLRVTDRAVGARRDQPVRRRRWHPADVRDARDRQNDGDGVGLRNTRERLRALYGSQASLTLDHRAGETTATVRIPAGATPTVPAVIPAVVHSLAGERT